MAVLAAWKTVAELVSDAALEMGLISTALADPYGSTDPNVLQLLALLKSGGRRLAKERPWSFLRNEYTFNTSNGVAAYALPTDFRSMIPQTGWNRTTQFSLSGNLSPQVWQYIQAIPSTSVVWAEFRLVGSQIKLAPTPTTIATIAFEYLTTYWVKPAAQASPTVDGPTVATDVICFDPLLVVKMLKAMFRKEKGMDATSAQDDFGVALLLARDEDAASPVHFIGGRPSHFKRLDASNMPDTGVGQ